MYISAIQIERDIKLYKHNHVEDAIENTAQLILEQLKEHLDLNQNEEFDTSELTTELLFASEDESDIKNAQKLQFLIDNVDKIIEKLEPKQEFRIYTYDDPSYQIEISKDTQEKIRVSSYSNLEDNNFWDEVIGWIEWGKKLCLEQNWARILTSLSPQSY